MDDETDPVLCPFLGMEPCTADCPSMEERACIIGDDDDERE
jgi:hypothetical protein